MPYCPKCRTEYREGFESCADCGSLLVREDPRPTTQHPHRGLWLLIQLCVAVFAAAISVWTAVAIAEAELPPCRSYSVALGLLCFGGLIVSIARPMTRFWTAAIVWLVGAALPIAFFLASLIYRLIEQPRVSHVRTDAEALGYLLAACLVGTVASLNVGRWLSGHGHRHGLWFLATTAAFLSSPYLIYWLLGR